MTVTVQVRVLSEIRHSISKTGQRRYEARNNELLPIAEFALTMANKTIIIAMPRRCYFAAVRAALIVLAVAVVQAVLVGPASSTTLSHRRTSDAPDGSVHGSAGLSNFSELETLNSCIRTRTKHPEAGNSFSSFVSNWVQIGECYGDLNYVELQSPGRRFGGVNIGNGEVDPLLEDRIGRNRIALLSLRCGYGVTSYFRDASSFCNLGRDNPHGSPRAAIQRGARAAIANIERGFDPHARLVWLATPQELNTRYLEIVNRKPWPVRGNELISRQSNLFLYLHALPDAGAKQAKSEERDRQGKGRIWVVAEFLPPIWLVFGIPAAMFAFGVYIEGRSFARAYAGKDSRWGAMIALLGMALLESLLFGDWWNRL